MEREVVGYDVHKIMLGDIAQNLFNNLSDFSRPNEVNLLKLVYKITIPDLMEVFSDVKRGKYLKFVSYSPTTGEPLIAVYDYGLVHVAKIGKKSYVVFPDWTHSNPIEGNIDRIYVNGEGKLVVDNDGKEVIVEKQDKKQDI